MDAAEARLYPSHSFQDARSHWSDCFSIHCQKPKAVNVDLHVDAYS